MDKAILHAQIDTDWSERRKTERVGLLVRVTYQTVDEIFSEFARNINEGGIFIETDTPQPAGSSVVLQFSLPGSDDPIEVTGTVVRAADGSDGSEPQGMGIEFDELGAGARKHINALIRHLRAEG
jgi:type IV pilus assembly protein PilZ